MLQPQLAKQMLEEMKSSAVPPAQVRAVQLRLLLHHAPSCLTRLGMQVAKLALDAVQQGRYIAKASSFGLALATAPGATIHPRVLPVVVELLLAPLSILVPYLMGRSLSRRIEQWRLSTRKQA